MGRKFLQIQVHLRCKASLGECPCQQIRLEPQLILVCSRPSPYECRITSRFPEVQSILVEEHEGFED